MSYPHDFSKRTESYHGDTISRDRNYQFWVNQMISGFNEIQELIEERNKERST